MNHLTPDVDAPASGHPGSELDAADMRVWAARITERWRASVQAIFDVGLILIEAKDRMPHGVFEAMIDKELPFKASTAQRLMIIARDNRLSNPAHVQLLPASWGTLYELTKLSDDEFNSAIEQRVIRPDMIRGEAEQIRPLVRSPSSDGGVEGHAGKFQSPSPKDCGAASHGDGWSEAGTQAEPQAGVEPGPSDSNMPSGGLAIAHRRIEEADSLDFFPTPPWATRALVERVLRHLKKEGVCRWQEVWEPACGEGHMAETLSEYFKRVYASDIADYGYGVGDHNFLTSSAPVSFDWIITNPPFNDSADFVLKAIRIAGTGVAMFVRLAWLESAGRYEKIFTPHPPTLISFFAERVPLHKGRWEEDGATMTAYIWLVWIKGAEPRAPFWIPPGCREALTKPEDAKRFGTKSPRRDAGARMEEGQPTDHIVTSSSEEAA